VIACSSPLGKVSTKQNETGAGSHDSGSSVVELEEFCGRPAPHVDCFTGIVRTGIVRGIRRDRRTGG
jgi:hypothetical protein